MSTYTPRRRRPSSTTNTMLSSASAEGLAKPAPAPGTYTRRQSNELAASVRLDQLRTLQKQLSTMIHDAKTIDPFDTDGSDEEAPAVTTVTATSSSIRPSIKHRSSLSKRSARLLATSSNDDDDEMYHDIETGQLPRQQPSSTSYRSRRRMSDVDNTPTLRPSAIIESSTIDDVDDAPLLPNNHNQPSSDMETKSNISSLDNYSSSHGTDPTVLVGSNGTVSGNTIDDNDNNPNDDNNDLRGSRWSRSRSIRSARSLSRSLSRDRRRPSSRSTSRRRSSIFKKNTVNANIDTISTSEHTTGSGKKAFRRVSLPNYDFLSKDDDEKGKEGGSLRPGAKWWHAVFVFSVISIVACIITLWAPFPIGARQPSSTIATMPWSNGCLGGLQSCICPRETICADDLLSMIFLTIARASAWFDYPLYMLLFLSKANNLNNFLQKTALRCWINFSDYHRVHSLFGMIVGVESMSHSFFHILRWARRRDDIQLLWKSKTGITGLIAISLVPFIVLPMTVPYIKSRMRFEWRKGLHYLSIVWGAALMCHAPQRIFWLIGIPFLIYAADKMAEGLFKTHLVESAHFQRLGDTSCIISFENPPGFGKQNSAYVYLMLPWLSKYQFHAFTVFPCTKPNHSSICIHKCGDWTGKLMKTITTPTHKPAFVVGPFLSPFSSPAMDSEFLVAVASGIGVTPAISLIKQYSSTSRRLNLVWICRDAGLVEHFLQNVEFGSDGYTLIYYTGKDRDLILRDELPPNVFIFNGRPNLERAISGIISSISTGEGLPEELHKKVLTRTPAEMRSKLLLERALSIYTLDLLFDYTVKASNHHNQGLQPLIELVNYQGVLSTMKHLLGEDCDLVTNKITKNFEKIDTNGDCRMDREEFEDFFNLMTLTSGTDSTQEDVSNIKRGLQRMDTCRDMFESAHKSPQSVGEQQKDVFGIKKHLQGDGKFSAQNWNMLYCGGSQPVLDQLNDFKRKFGIGLSVEKFDW